MYDGLPELCFGVLPTTKEVILIKRGESGYHRFFDGAHTGKEEARRLNKKWDVTPAQQRAMEHGSIFGWDTPAADPKMWEARLNNADDKRN